MKRLAVIAGIVLSAALIVGGFVLASSDNKGEAKSNSTTTVKSNEAKDAAEQIKQESLPPVPAKSDDNSGKGNDDNEELDGYEAKKAFVGVSPSKVRAGEKLQIEIRGFQKNSFVTVTIAPNSPVDVQLDKNGKGKLKVIAPAAAGPYTVVVSGLNQAGVATTITTPFTVVLKK